MWISAGLITGLSHFAATTHAVLADVGRFLGLCFRSRVALAAEGLFLRKQLALYEEREVQPDGATDAVRFVMSFLGRLFDWRTALRLVKPGTFVRWHRKGFHLFWLWKSRQRGRPTLPADLRKLIRRMAAQNPIWGEEKIADELLLKLGVRVSARTIGKYLARGSGPRRTPDPQQRWATFVRNHAKGTVACDFFVVVTATFRVLYVFVAIEVGTRRTVHQNVTAHPTPAWTIQQLREALPGDHTYTHLIHDRDRIYSQELDAMVETLGVRVQRTPAGAPKQQLLRANRSHSSDRVPRFSDSLL